MTTTFYIPLGERHPIIIANKRLNDGMKQTAVYDTLGVSCYSPTKSPQPMGEFKPYLRTNDLDEVMPRIDEITEYLYQDSFDRIRAFNPLPHASKNNWEFREARQYSDGTVAILTQYNTTDEDRRDYAFTVIEINTGVWDWRRLDPHPDIALKDKDKSRSLTEIETNRILGESLRKSAERKKL